MTLTRKSFLLRVSAATAGVVATSLAGAGTAQAVVVNWRSHLRSVVALTTNAAEQMRMIERMWPPGPACPPETQAELETIRAAAADVSAAADRLLGTCRG